MGAKKKRRKNSRHKRKSAGTDLRLARLLSSAAPLYGCWINQGWNLTGQATIIVAREMKNGRLMFACFYLDINGAGLTNCLGATHYTVENFRHEFLSPSRYGPLMRADISLIRNLLAEALQRAHAQEGNLKLPAETIHWLRLAEVDPQALPQHAPTPEAQVCVEYKVLDVEEVEAELQQMPGVEENEDHSGPERCFTWCQAPKSRATRFTKPIGQILLQDDQLRLELWRPEYQQECRTALEAFLGGKLERDAP